MSLEIRNARIERTFLGCEDHGIFTAVVHLDFGGTKQGFGCYDLRERNDAVKFIQGVLKAAGVSEWEKLPGKFCRVQTKDRKFTAIGHIVEDTWFYLSDLA